MSQTRACPVCGRPGLPSSCASCPQCDADLTCFQVLDSLASPAAAPAQTAAPLKRRFPLAAGAALLLLVLLLLAGLAASMKSRLSELDRQLAELKAAENGPPEQPVPAEPPAPAWQTAASPAESKIQIDTSVRIVDERKAVLAAGKAAAENSKPPAVKPDDERDAENAELKAAAKSKAAADAVEEHAAAPPPAGISGPPETAEPQAAQEDVQPPDRDGPLPHAPPPAVETAEHGAAAVPEKPEEEQPQSIAADRPASGEGGAAAQLPETPPVLLRPGFRIRKRRVQPAPPAVHEEAAPRPSAAAESADESASQQRPGGMFTYLVKEGETVWDIAGRFYGDRKYYPVVMEQNPHIFLGFIRKGSAVRLFANRKEAESLYERRTELRDGLLLWKYEVRPGETWRTVYARFFLPRYSGMIFYGNQDVAPGKTVLVILR